MSNIGECLFPDTPLASVMARYSGQETVDRLGNLDLNLDGEVVNLAIVGSSSFYNFEVFEENVEGWIGRYGYPDLVIVGGASGVDYMAERWADANIIPIAVFSEEWDDPTRSLVDRGRAEAPNTLTEKILNAATHLLAMPSPTSKWTRVVINQAEGRRIPAEVREVG
ncbi:MAG: hypothetical protein QF760_03445 [Candidatus Thalassarchaeaceae archaeon]|nr:hypothetical protein [Candidatus Thalassarchaeaceae archaeon]